MAATTIFVQADPFAGRARKTAEYVPRADVVRVGDAPATSPDREQQQILSALQSMPRPTLGVQVKPNTPAYAQVIDKNGNAIDLLNRSSSFNSGSVTTNDSGKVWTSWMLQAVREERMEKTQLVETFGDSYLYAYGEKPRSLQFQGLLLNTDDYDWKTDFWKNWEDNFRATRLVERQARMYIRFEDVLVEGYPINASVGQTADAPNAMPFSFLFFVTNYVNTQLLKGRRERPPIFTTNLNLQAREQAGIDIRSEQQILQRRFSQVGLSEKITDAILSGDTPTKWAQLGNLAALNGVNLGIDALKASAGGGTAALQSLSVDLARSSTSILQYLAKIGVENGTGMSMQDFNAWFGYAGGLLTLTLDISQNVTGPTTTAVGEAVDESLATLKEALTAGSVEALISKLGYAAGSALLEATQATNATTNANARSNAETSVSVRSAQQLSKSIGGEFQGTEAGQVSMAGQAGTTATTNVISL